MSHPFICSPVLTSEAVTLRPIGQADVPDILPFTVYDGVKATSEAAAAAILRRIAQDQRRGETVHWGVCTPGSDKVVGNCGFYRGLSNKVGEVGYVLHEQYRGRGLMTAAVSGRYLKWRLTPSSQS